MSIRLETLLTPFLTRLLQANFEAVNQARREGKRSKSKLAINEEAAFNNLFKYIVDVTKFNATAIQEDDLASMLDGIISICKKTTAESDIDSATRVINALLTYTTVPSDSVRPCLELLCDVHRQLTNIQKQAWEALANIFRSHLGQMAVLELIDILRAAPEASPPRSNVVRGAFHVLSRLAKENGREGLPRVSLSLLLQATAPALTTADLKLEGDFLFFLKDLIAGEDLPDVLAELGDWTDLADALVRCADDLSLGVATIQDAAANGSTIGSEDSGVRRRNDLDNSAYNEVFRHIISKFCSWFPRLEFIAKDAIVRLFLRLNHKLDDTAAETIVTHCAEDRMIYPSNEDWLGTAELLTTAYLYDQSRAASLRALVVSVMKDAFGTIEFLDDKTTKQFALMVLERMSVEQCPITLEALAAFAVDVVERAHPKLFDLVISILHATIFQRRSSAASTATSLSLSPQPFVPIGPVQPSMCRIVTKQIIRMFIALVNRSASKAESLFNLILEIAGSSQCATDARICAVKLVFRLRSDSNYAVSVRHLSESESIAAVLCRTAETAISVQIPDDGNSARDSRNISAGSSTSGAKKQFNVKTPVPPLWFYPGPKGLPEVPPGDASTYLYSYLDPESELPQDGRVVLKMTHWLETVISLIQQQDVEWEIYSYILVHLGAQLANRNLFKLAGPQIQFLRSVLCDQIRGTTFREPPSYTSLKKAGRGCLYLSYPHNARQLQPPLCEERARRYCQGLHSRHWFLG